ncbi:sigma-54-dependent transcriptional regulator [Nannocystis punicea]|uniref:Sigma-54 dependent transcriptional regulator n=1 Tax=Nannocystis punicea TaxID=2995304 RepID=A0ABY7GVR4_9BACT|nr:sigma-54 dependent transcriptional regulator [Nannocystis poenicansa]WAS91053.1 sigma-54 dependent transcriptional regulator [Nannocystis poenicansa]
MLSPTKHKTRILLVDDDLDMLEALTDGLTEKGFEVAAARSAEAALVHLAEASFDVMVTDLRMTGADGLTLLAQARALDPQLPVIVMTAYSALDTAIEAVRRGAFHYLAKPFRVDELLIFVRRAFEDAQLRREAEVLRHALRVQPGPPGVLGGSAAMQELFRILDRVAGTSAPVLITGETGTGKTLVASTIHQRSGRASAPLVALNCAALPENLLESELFGHVRGAFSGATSSSAGLFCAADGGSILLDEIGEMALPLQAKLLHVIERGAVRPIGGTKERPIDVRILAATNRDLEQAVREGKFREDLLYRLNLVVLELPPLRERSGDLPELIDHFLARARSRYPDSPVRNFSRSALERLLAHPWPGNVRELSHTIERLVLLGHGAVIEAADLPRNFNAPADSPPTFDAIVPMREMQRRYAAWVLEQVDGIRAHAARRLGIDVKTLGRLLGTQETGDLEVKD